MRDSNAYIQHFNPACRVARMLPALPIARLLFAMNDFDVPLQPTKNIFGRFLTKVWLSVLSFDSSLPNFMHHLCIDLSCVCGFNMLLLVLALCAKYNEAVTVMLAIVCLVLLLVLVVLLVRANAPNKSHISK